MRADGVALAGPAWYKPIGGPRGLPPSAGGLSPGILFRGVQVSELSIFVDESGDKTEHNRYFLLTLVTHDQAEAISEKVVHYERALSDCDLPNIPFHSEPLLNGHGEYSDLDISQRKRLLVAFNVFVQRLPIRYKTFVYRRREFDSSEKLADRMRRDIRELFDGDLGYYQNFDHVKIYYDNGQAIVRRALDEAVTASLSKQAVVRRRTTMTEYRLAQVADYLCTIELAAVKYAAKENGGTYDKFFGSVGSFKKNWLKQARRKRIT